MRTLTYCFRLLLHIGLVEVRRSTYPKPQWLTGRKTPSYLLTYVPEAMLCKRTAYSLYLYLLYAVFTLPVVLCTLSRLLSSKYWTLLLGFLGDIYLPEVLQGYNMRIDFINPLLKLNDLA